MLTPSSNLFLAEIRTIKLIYALRKNYYAKNQYDAIIITLFL